MANIERFDAALLHVYGYEELPNGPLKKPLPEKAAKRARLVAAAARHLHQNGIVSEFVLSGTSMLNRKEPLSTLTARNLFDINPEQIHTNPTALATTNQELKTLKKESKEHGWKNTVSIGWELHRNRIQILKDKIFKRTLIDLVFKKPEQTVTVLSAQEILSTYPSPHNQARYGRVIEAIENSESEQRWTKYEEKIVTLMKLPFVPEILDLIARVYRPKAD